MITHRPTRFGRLALALLLAVLVLATAGIVFWRLYRALPDVDGGVVVDDVAGPVEIVRDVDAVPHVRAQSDADAWFGLGYVHAQDRLWQMEFQRRVASGNLAEILGAKAVGTDELMRTIGFSRAAASAWSALSAAARERIESYLRGVNAFLATHHGTSLPVEFAILRFEPAPWRPEDVLGWQKVMAWAMGMNWRDELLRVRVEARVGTEAAGQLMPAYVADGPIIAPEFMPAETGPQLTSGSSPLPARRSSLDPSAFRLEPIAGFGLDFLALGLDRIAAPISSGSNNWVLGGTRTTSGRPLLANDPHLGAQLPAVWYLAHVSGGDLDVEGATLPGVPGVVVGHNRRIAWGMTNLMADVQDLYVEHVDSSDRVEYKGAWEPMQILRDTIHVKGQPDLPLRIRITRHGPLVSDVLPGATQPLALRWTGLDQADRTPEAFLGIDLAGSWAAFTEALALLETPNLNFVYADVDGNIGYIAPGAVPVRAAGDGTRPVPGWVPDYEWTGYVPFEALPRSFNPPRGFVATANNKAVSNSYPYLLSSTWEAPFRVSRIIEMIERRPRLGIEDVARMHADQRSSQARDVLPFLLRARTRTDGARAAIGRLRAWDGWLRAESPDAALFEAFYRQATRHIFEDEVGDDVWKELGAEASTVAKAMHEMIRSGDTRWCDDVRTEAYESCEDVLGAALEDALEDLRTAQGSNDMSKWRWGRTNLLVFPHMPLHLVAPLAFFLDRTVNRGGDAFTVNPTMPLRDQIAIASYRQIIDTSDWDRSRFMIPLGQSGELGSAHYADWLDAWQQVRYTPMRFSRRSVESAAADRLTLQPRRE